MKEITSQARIALSAAQSPSVEKRRSDPAQLREKCQQFEAIFVQSMFKSMRATVPESGLFEKGMGTEIFQEMRDTEMAQQLAHKQGLGLGEALFRQLQKSQDAEGSEEK